MSFEILSGNTEGFLQPIVIFKVLVGNGQSCFELRNSQYANSQVTLINIWVEFLHYKDFQSDDNDLEMTLLYFKKWNVGYVQRKRNLRHTLTYIFNIYYLLHYSI